MEIHRLGVISIVVLFAVVAAGAAHADPRGLWLAQDGAKVRVHPCGAGFCATIAVPKSRVDPETGAPWTDKHNPDAALRSRPLVGVVVIDARTPDGSRQWSGRLYNVDTGNAYSGHLREIDGNTIRIEGCVIGICGGQNLSRIGS
jgi:uncharacterized protein (DUF2147 family)